MLVTRRTFLYLRPLLKVPAPRRFLGVYLRSGGGFLPAGKGHSGKEHHVPFGKLSDLFTSDMIRISLLFTEPPLDSGDARQVTSF